MKSKPIAILVAVIVGGCSTVQLNQAEQIALPIAEAAAVAAGAYYGVPPSTSTAVVAAANDLWGAYQQAQAGQPVNQGALEGSVGNAIQQSIPAGTSQSKTVAALQAAATLMQNQSKTAPPPAAASPSTGGN
jgi:hypothetical protein